MEHKLRRLTDSAPRLDGKGAKFTVQTETAKPLTVAVTDAQMGDLVLHLLQLSLAAGQNAGDDGLSTGQHANVLPLEISGIGVMLGTPGNVGLVVPLGMFNLALQLPASELTKVGSQLASLGKQMESEPHTPQ